MRVWSNVCHPSMKAKSNRSPLLTSRGNASCDGFFDQRHDRLISRAADEVEFRPAMPSGGLMRVDADQAPSGSLRRTASAMQSVDTPKAIPTSIARFAPGPGNHVVKKLALVAGNERRGFDLAPVRS